MSLPKNTKKSFLARFDELIAEGRGICNSLKVYPPHSNGSIFITYTTYDWDPHRLEKWKTSCLTIFQQFARKGTTMAERLNVFTSSTGEKPSFQRALGILEAFKDDLEKGFLDDFLLKVEAEVAADYMGQAEKLLQEGQRGSFDHVPAAVLSGAVLEKALKVLCDRQQPKIPITNANGDSKTLNPLIDDLKKAGVFNELKAKQLRSWADIRNKAAHGEFNQFTKTDVEQMLTGIGNFLADYLQ